MDAGSSLDGYSLSLLPDVVLVLIISQLPFKDAVRSSVLSRRWRNLHREVKNVSFKESEFVTVSDDDDDDTKESKRTDFVNCMVDWVSKFSGGVIETFELYFYKPLSFEPEISSLIEFAATKGVKNLVLDFTHLLWFNSDVTADEEPNTIQLPDCVYKITSLVNLKLIYCMFDPSRLVNPGSVKSLYFGWMLLPTIASLLSKAPLLEVLRIKYCWNVGLEAVTGYNNRLTKLVFKKCSFIVGKSKLDLPMIRVFKYSGNFQHFKLVNVNKMIEEVVLDFKEETEYDKSTRSHLHRLLCDLSSTRKLTVCPFVLQLIDDSSRYDRRKVKMEVKHLILKTNLDPKEFMGIRFMFSICPFMETLSFHTVITRPLTRFGIFDAESHAEWFWKYKRTHSCLQKTLKNVELRYFLADPYELQWLRFLVGNGRVLERIDLYVPSPSVVKDAHMLYFRDAAEKIATTYASVSKQLIIYLHKSDCT